MQKTTRDENEHCTNFGHVHKKTDSFNFAFADFSHFFTLVDCLSFPLFILLCSLGCMYYATAWFEKSVDVIDYPT